MSNSRGVDLSHHNDHVDFHTLKANGIDFVALKATEGVGVTDPTYVDRIKRARTVGFKRILHYHFYRPHEDPILQAKHFFSTVQELQDGERVVLDIEEGSGGWSGPSDMDGIKKFLLEASRDLGIGSSYWLIYTSPGWARGAFAGRLKELTMYPLWAAHYAATVGDISPWTTWKVWQNSDRGVVQGAGAAGTVDTDVWNIQL
ncbi:MAG TPA: glycoside hydrolase family 25 protein [Fimbriimonas sp.]|nr:glycoside hydrolase family 25 protein [Fimbriimonas sp.]